MKMITYTNTITRGNLTAEFEFRNAEDRDKFAEAASKSELIRSETAGTQTATQPKWYGNATIAWATAFLTLIALWIIGVIRIT